MLVAITDLLQMAEREAFAVGAFNVYNMEGAQAVIAAAEANCSPAILQLHPGALRQGKQVLVALCKAAAESAKVPISFHLDHATSEADVQFALEQGFSSVMFDGSALTFQENLERTLHFAVLAHKRGIAIEAELGRLSGSEDGLSVPEYRQRLTDPDQAARFVQSTGIDSLAVCIGNVHGRTANEPELDFARLTQIRNSVSVPLVLHGASGLANVAINQAIRLGVRKLNVNTELREAYIQALERCLCGRTAKPPDVVDVIAESFTAMERIVSSRLQTFGSVGKALELLPEQ